MQFPLPNLIFNTQVNQISQYQFHFHFRAEKMKFCLLTTICLSLYLQVEGTQNTLTTSYVTGSWNVWVTRDSGIIIDILDIMTSKHQIQFTLTPETSFRTALNKVNQSNHIDPNINKIF